MNIQELGQKAKSLLNNLVKSSTGAYFNATQKISPAYFQLKDQIQKLNATPTAQFLSQPFPFRVAQGLGNVLQKVPEYRPFGKYTDTLAPALVHVPMLAKSYGSTLSRLADPKKLVTDYKAHPIASGFEDLGNVSDFAPAMAVMGGLKVKGGNRIINTLESKLLNKDTKVLKSTVDEASRYVEEALNAKMPKGMTNRVAEVVDSFKKMGKDKNIMNGLMNESPAQTAFRRSQSLRPEDVYKGTIEKGLNKPRDFISEMKREYRDIVRNDPSIPQTEKVGILDYLRTPDRIMEKIGLGNEAKSLRTSWDSYQKELPLEIGKVTQWSNRVPSPESNLKIFKYLDGQTSHINLSGEEAKVAGEIKNYLSGMADRLHLPKDNRITSYITHIFEKGDSIDFNDEIAGLIRENVAGSVYDPFVQKRLGKTGYVEDTWRALDAYIKRGVRKANLDPILDVIKGKSEGLEDSQYKFVKTYIDRVNMRPTDVDIAIDNSVKSMVGGKFGPRPVTEVTKKARQWVYRGLLGLNPASALRNLSQGANTYAELGEKYTTLGYLKTIQNLPKLLTNKQTELEAVGVLRDNFIQDRTLSSTKNFLQKFDQGLFYMFEMAEKINRSASYFGSKAKYLKLGLSEEQAVQKAKDIVRKTQFTFGSVDTPLALSSDIAKTLGQFQSFTLKQMEFLGEKVKDKDIAGILRYIGSTLFFGLTVGKVFGWEVKDMIPSVRLGVPPTMQLPQGLIQSIPKDENDPDKNFFERVAGNANVQKGLMSYIPAGGQIRKTYQGLNLVNKGYNGSVSDRVRYSAPDSLLGKAQAMIFGPSATNNAKDYFDNNRSPLGETQSEKFKALIQDGFTPSDAIKPFRDMQEKAKEKKQIEESLKSGKVPVDTTALQKYFELDQVANMTEDNLYSKAKKQQAIFSKISEILNDEIVPDDKKTEVLQSMGISKQYAEYYNIAKESPEIRTAYMMDKMSEVDSIDDLVKYRTSVNGKVLLTTEVLNNLVEAGVLDSGSARLLKNLTIKNGQVITPIRSGSARKLPTFKAPKISMGRKITAPKLGRLKLRRFDSKGLRIPEVKIKPTQLKFSNESSTSNMYRLRV